VFVSDTKAKQAIEIVKEPKIKKEGDEYVIYF